MPEWRNAVRERLRNLRLEPAREAEIVEELSAHLDDRFRELRAAGAGEAEAVSGALEDLEGIGIRASEHPPALPLGSREGKNLAANLWHDCKVGVRVIRRRPGFSAAVVLLLAVGVAGNAAIFSIFDGLLLKPLPFADPERLVDLDETAPKWNLQFVGISDPDWYAWRKGNTTFDGMAFFSGAGANLADGKTAQRVKIGRVTYDLPRVLGLKPVLGREFLPEEDRPGGAKVAVLGYDLWLSMFHGDRHVPGRILKLDEQPYTVVGVLPREAVLPENAELWVPLAADTAHNHGWYLSGVGRLKRGVTLEQATADLRRIHRALVDSGQNANRITSPVMQPLRDRYLGALRPVARLLLGAVAVVLLIVCVNIAGLMLVRGEERSREIAIRTAIGASRGRVIRQLLTESTVLAALGGMAGVALGVVFLRGLLALKPETVPKWVQFSLDGRFAAFCIAVTGAAALLSGLAPAIQAAGVDTRGWLQEAARSTLTRGRRAVLGGLVAAEVALALILLVGSGLLIESFRNLMHVDLGFRPQNVVTWTLDLPQSSYPSTARRFAFYSALVERLRGVPGAASVSAASIVPLNGHMGTFFVAEDGRQLRSGEKNPVVLQVTALAGYFQTMGMAIQAGRAFETRDEPPDAPKVAIVNETFARQFWGNRNAVGKRIRYEDSADWLTIVGVVHDMRHYALGAPIRPEVFTPYFVSPYLGNDMTIAMRSAADPGYMLPAARETVRRMDPDLAMFDVRTMTGRIDRSLGVRRAYSWLVAAFAAVALLLAAAGIYSVISFAVSRRTREIGIRMALGAQRRDVVRTVLGGGMLLVTIGTAVGLAGAQLAARLLQGLLYGIGPRDFAIYGVVIGLVVAIGLLANWIPARRAAAVDPVKALRAE